MSDLKIEYISTDKLIPYINNPRVNDNAVDKVAASIKEFGFKVPIIIDKENVIITGHTRLLASKKLGLREVPVIRAEDLTEQQIKAFRIADNKTTEFSEWDTEKLAIELEGLEDIFTGFDRVEIEDLIGGGEAHEDDFDAEAEAERIIEPVTRRGDVWQLGRHRLMCGDAASEADIKRLMEVKKADLVFADPPYNIGFDYWDYLDNKDAGEYKKWCEQWFKILVKYSPVILITIGQWNMKMWFDIEKPLGIIAWIARNKTSGSKISLFSVWEPVLVYAKKVRKYKRNKADIVEGLLVRDEEGFVNDVNEAIEYVKNNCDLVEINNKRQADVELHKCPKQVSLLKELLLRYSSKNELVLDVFGGSGTTLIACEQLNRTCYMMEIDPVYCDVIVKRWENFTGQKAEMISG